MYNTLKTERVQFFTFIPQENHINEIVKSMCEDHFPQNVFEKLVLTSFRSKLLKSTDSKLTIFNKTIKNSTHML